MSVAPDIAPEVVVPARARRTARTQQAREPGADRTVTGNVITPSAFHAPSRAEPVERAAPVEPVAGLWLVPGGLAPARAVGDGEGDPRATRFRRRDEPGPKAGVRLTARGRLVVALAAVVLALGISFAAWFGAAGASPQPAEQTARTQIVVHDGDTLWSIASGIDPNTDPRAVVERLRRMNGLSSVVLMPGQILRLR